MRGELDSPGAGGDQLLEACGGGVTSVCEIVLTPVSYPFRRVEFEFVAVCAVAERRRGRSVRGLLEGMLCYSTGVVCSVMKRVSSVCAGVGGNEVGRREDERYCVRSAQSK
jgi:hypothetical protein